MTVVLGLQGVVKMPIVHSKMKNKKKSGEGEKSLLQKLDEEKKGRRMWGSGADPYKGNYLTARAELEGSGP